MNPSSSSSKSTKTTHNRACTKIEQRTKKQQHCSRNPLQDLNPAISTCSNNCSGTTSTSSIEAPKGCLRFFLSHSSSSNAKTPFIDRHIKIKPLAKTTPKSAPNLSKPSKCSVLKKPNSQKGERVKKTTPCLYPWQSGRKSGTGNALKSKISSGLDTSGNPVNKVPPGSELGFCDGNEVNLTPPCKTATGSVLDFRVGKDEFVVDDNEKLSNTTSCNKSKTPPIQPSVSPEMQTQCISSLTATDTTPACYAAGHVVSGVTDKRKCRPRGILTVGDNSMLDFAAAKSSDSFDGAEVNRENIVGVVGNSSSVSVLPLPAEASMQWLLSPFNVQDENEKENSEIGLCRYQLHSPSSDLFDDEFDSDLCNHSISRSSGTVGNRKRTSTSLCSPCEVPEFEGILGTFHDNVVTSSSPNCTPSCKGETLEEGKKRCCDFDGEISPLSVDILGSGNVIQTPQSDSSLDICVGLSQLKAEAKHHFDSELHLVAESLQMTSLSSKGHESIWDPTNASSQFDCLTIPSNSIDLSQYQKILDDQASWMSTSSLGNVSQPQMRISWREGLVSQIFEMDEFDSCRYLSDEEEDASGYYNDHLKSCQKSKLNGDVGDYEILRNGFGSTEFVDTEPEVREKGEERLPSQVSCSCAESISTDGGGLAASGDSDWTLCYKNELFKL